MEEVKYINANLLGSYFFGDFFHLIDCLCVICFVITDYYNIQCGGQHERAVLRSAREIAQVRLYYT